MGSFQGAATGACDRPRPKCAKAPRTQERNCVVCASAGCVSIGRHVDDAGSGIHAAVRELVGQLDRPDSMREPARDNDSSSEVVLLDIELDGLRYLLMRMPRQSQERLQLSPREYEIVRMVAKGHPNKVIADVLNISSWTVCTHL